MAAENSNDNLDDSMVYEELSSVEEKCEEYIELYRNGDAPTFAQFAAQTPELESQILELLPTIVMMEGARSRSLERRKDGRVMRGPEQITKLDDYRIIREIGRGGMGIVYEAHQISLNRLVAIKLLPKYMLNDDQVLKFKLEASTAAKLHHTNIAPIYGVGESSGYHYYAMQLLDGVSMDRYVGSEEEPPAEPEILTIEQVINVGRQVASALQYAHDQGVLHRDIKPSNLILDSDGNVWMTDFGLAISRDSIGIGNAGSNSGTLRYMAPEKFEDAPDDVTGDIYALGITLIELLTGRPAFSSVRISQLTSDIQSGKLDTLSHNGKKLSGDFAAVLRKSIAVNPANRYQSADEFRVDLKNALETRPVSAKRATKIGNSWRWVKRNRALTAASAIALEMLIATSIISTVAYLRVQHALNSETEQRERAENTSSVAAVAMDRMFRQLSGGANTVDPSLETYQSYPLLTNESAELAKQLSDFYLQLASENEDDERLSTNALAARSRVGELNERLGRYTDAAEAFRKSINGYQSLLASSRIENSVGYAIEIARLMNQLGLVKSTTGDIGGAELEHQTAIDLLTSKMESTNRKDIELELELARSFYLKAKRTRPGMGPNSFPPVAFSSLSIGDENSPSHPPGLELTQSRLNALRSAIDILQNLEDVNKPQLPSPSGGNSVSEVLLIESLPDELAAQETTARQLSEEENLRRKHADAGRFLLALCYRELANDNWSERTEDDRNYQNQSIALLEGLVKARPREALFQFELIRTLAEINVFESIGLDRDAVMESYDAVKRAIELGEALRQSQPGIANYQVELIHCHFKLGRLAELKSRLADAETSGDEKSQLLDEQEQEYRWAMLRQVNLARIYPDSAAYRVWSVRFMLSLAQCQTMQSKIDARNRLISRATSILNRLPEDVLEKPEVEIIRREAAWMNQRSLAVPEIQ